MDFFQYGDKEIEYLKKRDTILAKAIEELGFIKRTITKDVFTSLIESIIGQQISSKAATTICKRLVELVGTVTPENIFATNIEDIQKCGMSMRKAGYIKGIAESVINKELVLDEFPSLSDDEIIKKLSALSGIGVWTAEMILIFSLNRMDVLSYKDLAICRGIKNLYGLDELTKKDFEKYRETYSPYGSVASLYLWAKS